MGSIRGRVRIHVPKDRRGTREKVYGGSARPGPFLPSALLALSLPTKLSSPLSLHSLTLLWVSHCFLYLVPQWSLAWLYTCWYLSTASSFGSWLTDPDQMHPETLKQDRWVLCHQVRHYNNTHKHHQAVWLQTDTAFGLHAPHFEEPLLFYEMCCSFPVIWLFQNGSTWRKVLGGDTCLLHVHRSQYTGEDLFMFWSISKEAESLQILRAGCPELFRSGLQILLCLQAHFICSTFQHNQASLLHSKLLFWKDFSDLCSQILLATSRWIVIQQILSKLYWKIHHF